MKRAVAVLVLTIVLVAGVACSRDERPSVGQIRLVPGPGAELEVGQPGAAPGPSTGPRTLATGARIRVLAGSATVTLPTGDRLELAEGADVRVEDRPELLAGRLLLVPGGAGPLVVDAAGSTVTALGPARVERDLAVTAASYRTGARLESAGRRLRVPPLRQASIASLGEVPTAAAPIVYDPADPWDREYLPGVAELAAELDARSRGFSASVAGGEGRTPGFYRLLLPALEDEAAFDARSLEPARPPGELLVGLAIAVAGSGGTFSTRRREIFELRDAGADWGLVALDQGVTAPPVVVAAVDQAIGRAPLAFAPPPSTRPVDRPVPASRPPESGPPAPAPAPTVPGTAPPAAPPIVGPPPPAVGGTPPVSPPTTQRPLLAPVTDLLVGLLPGLVSTEP